MKRMCFILVGVLLAALWMCPEVVLASEPIDFISDINKVPGLSRKLGLHKLTAAEKSALNTYFNLVFKAGVQAAFQASKQPKSNLLPRKPTTRDKGQGAVVAYRSKIESDDDDLIRLEDGTIVEITFGFVGFIGLRKDAVLFRSGPRWKLWIEGKKSFPCSVLKGPEGRPLRGVELLDIHEVKGDGKILSMSDGSLYEVDDLYTLETSLWLGMSPALIIAEAQLINLDEGGEMIEVTKLR